MRLLDLFEVSSFDNRALATSSYSHTVWLHCPDKQYTTNPERPNGNFPMHAFYKISAL